MAQNPVQAALTAFGGVTQAVVATGIPAATWHYWRKIGRIANARHVFVVAEATGLSPRELAGVPESTTKRRRSAA